jgi:hypothetical protein
MRADENNRVEKGAFIKMNNWLNNANPYLKTLPPAVI